MIYEGVLSKMNTKFANPIDYELVLGEQSLFLNPVLNKEIEITFVGYQCLSCGKKKKIYRQGFCYDCFYASASVGDWIMRPELSTAHLGIEDRDLEYEKQVQLQPHVVYLALSSGVKVGVTRKTQVPTRWIDQGAIQAIEIVEVPNRYLAGITEVALKNHYADKTNWRKMLTNKIEMIDLEAERTKLESLVPEEVKPYFAQTQSSLQELSFPVLAYPEKVASLNLEKTPNFRGVLTGIKGQYLMFEGGTVFNVRGSEGLVVQVQA